MTNSASESATSVPTSAGKRVSILLGLGLAVAVIVGIAVEQLQLVFDVDPALLAELEASTTPNPSPALMEQIRLSGMRAERLDAAVFVGLLGAVAAGAFAVGAVATGIKRGNAAVAIVIGVVAGGILGTAGGYASEMIAQEIEVHEMDELFRSLVVHVPAFALIGLAAGFAAGGLKGAVLGCTAGLITVPICVFGGMILFPQEKTLRSIPQESFHFTAWCVVALGLCALAVGRGLSAPPVAGTAEPASPDAA